MKPEYDAVLKIHRFPTQGMMIRREFYQAHGCYSEHYKIVSDSIFKIQHFPKSKWLVLDFPLVLSPGGGVSGTVSWSNTMENVIVFMFFHKYPFFLRLRSSASQIVQYFRSIIRFI